jgi:hypothetical protein
VETEKKRMEATLRYVCQPKNAKMAGSHQKPGESQPWDVFSVRVSSRNQPCRHLDFWPPEL